MRAYFHFTLQNRCPKCGAGPSHWCRDERGKCIAPHQERRREALKVAMSAFAPLKRKDVA